MNITWAGHVLKMKQSDPAEKVLYKNRRKSRYRLNTAEVMK